MAQVGQHLADGGAEVGVRDLAEVEHVDEFIEADILFLTFLKGLK